MKPVNDASDQSAVANPMATEAEEPRRDSQQVRSAWSSGKTDRHGQAVGDRDKQKAAATAVTGAITLADVAVRAEVLVVACTRCDRAGLYSLHTLIKRYNRPLGVPALLGKLSTDCPTRKSVSGHDLCGQHCPELPTLFVERRTNVHSRTFRDLRSAPHDGSAIEVQLGPAKEVVLALWSGQSQSWVKVSDPRRETLHRVTGWRPAPAGEVTQPKGASSGN